MSIELLPESELQHESCVCNVLKWLLNIESADKMIYKIGHRQVTV